MGGDYLIIVDRSAPSDRGPSSLAQAARLHAMGLRLGLAAGPAALYVAEEVPIIATPGGGVVIGHLFARDGTPFRTSESLAKVAGHESFGERLLKQCWGDYLLVQPSHEPGRVLHVLRDPSGALPCVYAFDADTGFLTSNLSLATRLGLHRRLIDWDFIEQALAYPRLKTQRTAVAGVCELLPGFSLTIEAAKHTVRSHWTPWTFVAPDQRHRNPRDAIDAVREAVTLVVKTSAALDGSILLELSGGLDSSIVAACLRGTGSKVTCCTLVTPLPGADEHRYAALMADALGTELHTATLSLDAPFESPLPPSAVTPRMAMLQFAVDEAIAGAAAEHSARSLYSGGGGDTVFSYLHNAAPAADAFQEHGLRSALVAIRDLSDLHQCTLWKAGRLTLRKLRRGARPLVEPDRSFLSPALRSGPADRHPWSEAPADAFPGDCERIMGLAGTQIFREGAPRGLQHGLRLPLLSQPVMEACLSVPTWMCIGGGENRAIARAAFSDVLPPDVLRRQSKVSFTYFCGAVYQRQKRRMEDFLLSGQLRARGLLDPEALYRSFRRPPAPRDDTFMRLFDLCMIENWVRQQS